MIRFVIEMIYLLLAYICSWPLYIIELIIRSFNPKAAANFSHFFLKYIAKIIFALTGSRLTVKGLENIPKDTAVLFVGNHISYLDIVISIFTIPRVTGFIAKKDVFKVPLLHGWATRIHSLALDRDDIRQGLKVILAAIEEIKSGYSMFVFPEGTRSKDGNFHDFKQGSFKIATKTGCPIIPVAITGTADIFENHIPFVKSVDVKISFGEPIVPDSLSKEELKHIAVYAHDIVNSMLLEHKQASSVS